MNVFECTKNQADFPPLCPDLWLKLNAAFKRRQMYVLGVFLRRLN